MVAGARSERERISSRYERLFAMLPAWRPPIARCAGRSPVPSDRRSLLDDDVEPTRELREVEYLHVRARSIISEVPRASRMPFRYTVNPYRGCSHACTYCFARPTHEYLGLNGLEDFERRIVVKINAVERLPAELARPSWGGEHIALGTNTDPYQQAEGRYRLTRGVAPDAGPGTQPLLGADEVDHDPARSRCLPGGGRAHRRAREPLDRDARRRGLARERAGHATAARDGSRRSLG